MTMKQCGAGVVLLIVILFVTVFWAGESVLAAESTSDVVVDSTQKEKLRQEIVGNMELAGEQQEYVIGYSDILSISIYGEGDMNATTDSLGEGALSRIDQRRLPAFEYRDGSNIRQTTVGIGVRIDGRVSLKHIGDVKVVGMSLSQLADYLKKLYITVFDDPIVTVSLLQSNSRRYTVMGQVNNPGIVYLDFPITIVQAIAHSGGFTEWANHDVTIIRQGSDLTSVKSEEKKTLKFDYDDFLKGKYLEKNVYIQPNDVVIIH